MSRNRKAATAASGNVDIPVVVPKWTNIKVVVSTLAP